MQIRKQLKKDLEINEINPNEGITTLLILKYELFENNSIMKDEIICSLSRAGMISYNFEKEKYEVSCKIFDESDSSDIKNRFTREFLLEYVKIFKKANKERSADTTSVRNKLVKLISERDCTVTNEEIINAAKLYVSRAIREGKTQYIMQADYFIQHREKGFSIMKYIEELRENENINNDFSNPFDDTL